MVHLRHANYFSVVPVSLVDLTVGVQQLTVAMEAEIQNASLIYALVARQPHEAHLSHAALMKLTNEYIAVISAVLAAAMPETSLPAADVFYKTVSGTVAKSVRQALLHLADVVAAISQFLTTHSHFLAFWHLVFSI